MPDKTSLLDIFAPSFGESVTTAVVASWNAAAGVDVRKDDVLAELETEKIAMQVVAPADGRVAEVLAKAGDTIEAGALLARLLPVVAEAPIQSAPATGHAPALPTQQPPPADRAPTPPQPPPHARVQPPRPQSQPPHAAAQPPPAQGQLAPAPLANRAYADGQPAQPAAPGAQSTRAPTAPAASAPGSARPERLVRLSPLRLAVAKRLKQAQTEAAVLTTFNEADMTEIMRLRKVHGEAFQKRHGVRLGYMGFFVRAAVAALKEIPQVNTELRGNDLVYKDYYDIGVAVGTERGLVVPVVKDAGKMSLADLERAIAALATKAREGTLAMSDLQGGTFTITNGGVYGSLMSTPIINAPQSGILGMHRIQERPMIVGGKIEPRAMMYLAFSYDHRIIDGRESVTFLAKIKKRVEAPESLLLD